jgi:O-antigen/teichoic acid export membrane protein
MRYEVAIPLPKADGSATVMLVLAAIVVMTVTVLTSVLALLYGEGLMEWTNTPGLTPNLWTVPLGVLLMGLHGVFIYWGLRKRAFGLVARTRVQQGIGMSATQLGLGYLQFGPLGLIIGHIVGFTAGLVSLARFWYSTGAKTTRSLSFRRMYRRALRYRDYPLYSSWGGVVNTAGLQLPIILFSSLYAPVVAGLYLLANRVANAPVALVAEAVGKVFYVSAVSARRQGRLPQLTLAVFEALLKACLVPFALIAVVAPDFFGMIFGYVWSEAGVYMQWLALLMAAVFVFAPLAMLYSVLYRHREDLYFQAALFIIRIGAITIGSQLGGPLMAVALFASSASLVYLIFGLRLLRLAGVASGAMIRVGGRELAIAAVAGLSIFCLRWLLIPNGPVALTAGVGLLVIITVAMGALAVLRARRSLATIQRLGVEAS